MTMVNSKCVKYHTDQWKKYWKWFRTYTLNSEKDKNSQKDARWAFEMKRLIW